MLLGCPEKRIAELGEKKFCQFVDLLKSLSAIVVDMVELKTILLPANALSSAHAVSWMLGCTEYGLLSSSGMEIGYYDRLETNTALTYGKISQTQTRSPINFPF